MRILLFFLAISTTTLHANQNSNSPQKSSSTEKTEDQKEKPQLTSTVAFLSDYRSRGISQTMRRPAVQGEFKYVHPSGLYFKSWGSNVDGTGNFINNTSLEWDFYAGFKHALFTYPINYDIGLLYYYYPGGRELVRANTHYDTLEYYVSLSYKIFELRLWQTLTDYFGINSSAPPMNWEKGRPTRPNGHSYGSPYLEANLEVPLFPKWKAIFHLGYQAVTNYSQLNYLDWLVTFSRQFEWFEATVTYVSTNARKAFYNIPDNSFRRQKRNLGGSGIVVGVDRTF